MYGITRYSLQVVISDNRLCFIKKFPFIGKDGSEISTEVGSRLSVETSYSHSQVELFCCNNVRYSLAGINKATIVVY